MPCAVRVVGLDLTPERLWYPSSILIEHSDELNKINVQMYNKESPQGVPFGSLVCFRGQVELLSVSPAFYWCIGRKRCLRSVHACGPPALSWMTCRAGRPCSPGDTAASTLFVEQRGESDLTFICHCVTLTLEEAINKIMDFCYLFNWMILPRFEWKAIICCSLDAFMFPGSHFPYLPAVQVSCSCSSFSASLLNTWWGQIVTQWVRSLWPWSEGCWFRSRCGQSNFTVKPLIKAFNLQLLPGLVDHAFSIARCFRKKASAK